MPLAPRTFNQLIDFTRTSSATYVDATGKIVPTAASRNLLTFTQEFDNAAWSKANATITANSTTAPDGTLTADTLVENTATSSHSVAETVSGTTVGSTYTASVYAKPNGRNWIIFDMSGSSTYAFFNVATGAVGTTSGSPTATITSVGNGWYRCSMTKAIGAGISAIRVYTASADNTTSYTGDGTSGVFLWGAQLEAGSTLTDYTRNVGGVYPPRFDYDPVTLAPRGLLVEEQRTNLLVRSEEFDNASWNKAGATVTANATISPDGTADADAFIESTNTGAHHVSVLPGAGVNTYTFSFYAKANGRTQVQVEQESGGNSRFTLSGSGTATALGANTVSITPLSNGWYRCTTTFTVTGAFGIYMALYNGSTTYTGDGTSGIFVWGAQLEAGSFATSYIPTVASQVTRTQDTARITAANFSQWYNQSAGTFVVEGDYVANMNWRIFMTVDDTADVGRNRILINGDQTQQLLVTTSGVNQANLNAGTSPAANTVTRIASAYALDNFAAVRDGGTVATDTSGTVPTVNRLNIGLHPNGAEYLNGHIRSIRYYPTRLSNAQLQALTA